MSEAPERIWATGTGTTGSWNSTKMSERIAPRQINYVRADIADALAAENARLREALETIHEVCDELADAVGAHGVEYECCSPTTTTSKIFGLPPAKP